MVVPPAWKLEVDDEEKDELVCFIEENWTDDCC